MVHWVATCDVKMVWYETQIILYIKKYKIPYELFHGVRKTLNLDYMLVNLKRMLSDFGTSGYHR